MSGAAFALASVDQRPLVRRAYTLLASQDDEIKHIALETGNSWSVTVRELLTLGLIKRKENKTALAKAKK